MEIKNTPNVIQQVQPLMSECSPAHRGGVTRLLNKSIVFNLPRLLLLTNQDQLLLPRLSDVQCFQSVHTLACLPWAEHVCSSCLGKVSHAILKPNMAAGGIK